MGRRGDDRTRSDRHERLACMNPPLGWECTRGLGHDGPCAAHQVTDHRGYRNPTVTATREPHTLAQRLARTLRRTADRIDATGQKIHDRLI